MPLLQVRNFPEDIYEKIKREAKRENRTITQQTVVLIKRGLGEKDSSRERMMRALEKTKNMVVSEEAKKIDVVQWMREDRAR
jgi:NAD(P)H-hydrate repair Nnr-like enzyme with NAD(P)H-hydrate dehydratase domain